MRNLYFGLLAPLLNLLIMPFIIHLAGKKGWFDKPNNRKIHTVATPRLGGVGIIGSFTLAIVFMLIFSPTFRGEVAFLWPLGLILIAVHLVGLLDDFVNLMARYRFVFQLVIAIIVAGLGYRFRVVNLLGLGNLELGWLSWPITIIWVVGAINAINMIDGLDGLSGGISFIALQSYMIFFLVQRDFSISYLTFALSGSVLVFLLFNLPPARIFMGDSGSTSLGFILAMLPLLPSSWPDSGFRMWDAGTILLIPTYDVISSIIRRTRMRVSLAKPDKWHLHHKLLHFGYNARTILAFVYSLSVYISLSVGIALYLSGIWHWIVLLHIWIIILVFFLVLHYKKERSLNRGSNENSKVVDV